MRHFVRKQKNTQEITRANKEQAGKASGTAHRIIRYSMRALSRDGSKKEQSAINPPFCGDNFLTDPR